MSSMIIIQYMEELNINDSKYPQYKQFSTQLASVILSNQALIEMWQLLH